MSTKRLLSEKRQILLLHGNFYEDVRRSFRFTRYFFSAPTPSRWCWRIYSNARRGPGDGGGPSSGRFLTYSNTPLPICRFLPLPMMAADVSISISFLVSLVEGNPFYIFPSCEDSENGNESGKKKSFSFF